MSKYAKEFYWAFVISAIVCFSPSKILAYGVPYIFLGYLVVKNVEVKKTIVTLYFILTANLAAYCFYYSLYGNTIFQNHILTLLTYSSIIPVVVLDNRKLAQPYLLKKICIFLSFLFFIEGGLGIMQALYGALVLGKGFDVANGDHVEGTIHPQPEPELAFSNPMFATNMTYIGLALLAVYFIYGRGKKYRLFIGFFSIILASVMHVLFLAFVAALLSYLILRPEFIVVEKMKSSIRSRFQQKGIKVFIMAFAAFIIAAPIYFLSTNVKLIESFATKTFLGDTPKAKITIDAFSSIPDRYPAFPIFGFGPGQFTSRASLIGSGVYLGGVDKPKPPPLLENKMNSYAEKIVIPYLIESQQRKILGSTGFPHYSWLSVYSELGLIGFLGITFFVIYLALRAVQRAKKGPSHRIAAFLFCTGLGLLYLLGVQENYWEVPQAIFLGVILLKLLYACLTHLDSFEDRQVVLLSNQDIERLRENNKSLVLK